MLRKIRDVPSSDVNLKNSEGSFSINRGRRKAGNRNKRGGLSIKSRNIKEKEKEKEVKTTPDMNTNTTPPLTSKNASLKLKKKAVEC